ncbi:hypothetical protein FB45DRAFT_1068279 [Roridomyces roridus]|uniref:Uncharacterized protein n=1 Tax=Roridomyces roridus TaxID=1738132 RepID=A0AAD7B112_9AGAR|nr:hypothetical protein FB45DRAFT_1068279 [Roridomyces roridus]
MDSDAEKELYENMVNEGAFAGVTAVLLKKMGELTFFARGEMNMVGGKETREVVKVLSGAFHRWFYVAQAIQTFLNVHPDLREMADEMAYYAQKLRNIHERRSNIRRMRRWLRFYVPFIVLVAAFVFCLAVVLGAVDVCWEGVCWEGVREWAFNPLVAGLFTQLCFSHGAFDASKTSDFEDTLSLLIDALEGLGETYRRLDIAADVRARDSVAVAKILQAQGHKKLSELIHEIWF